MLPKMESSHWDAAILYDVQFAQHCDQTQSCKATLQRLSVLVLPCPKTQDHQSTCVESKVHRVPTNENHPLRKSKDYVYGI